jgi:pyrophosphatase PpaX
LAWPTVVFDLDGTLVDTINLIVASYQHAFRTVLGREEDEARIRAWIGQPLLRCFRESSPAHADALFAAYTTWNEANTERLVRGYAGVASCSSSSRAKGRGWPWRRPSGIHRQPKPWR